MPSILILSLFLGRFSIICPRVMTSRLWPMNSPHPAARTRSTSRQRGKQRGRKLRVRKPRADHHKKNHRRSHRKSKKKDKLLRPKLQVK